MRATGQIILEKQQLDLFTNPTLPKLLEELAADEYVVYGVVTEYCVKLAPFALCTPDVALLPLLAILPYTKSN